MTNAIATLTPASQTTNSLLTLFQSTTVAQTATIPSCFIPEEIALHAGDLICQETWLRDQRLHRVDATTAAKIQSTCERLTKANTEIRHKLSLLLGLRKGASAERNTQIRDAKLRTIDARIAQLTQQLKPPFDFHATLSNVLGTLQSSLDDASKRAAIESIRQGAGISAEEMRTLFTNRIRDSFQDSTRRLTAAEQAMSSTALSTATPPTTIGTPAIFANRIPFYEGIRQASAVRATQSEAQRLRELASFTAGLYPPPKKKKGFFGKLKKGFSKVGHALKQGVKWTARIATQTMSIFGQLTLNKIPLLSNAWSRIDRLL